MKAILVGVFSKIPIPSPAMVVALLALFIAASGTAVAAISFTDANGNITACVDNNTGALRVLQSGQTSCTSEETPLAWKDGSTLLGKNDKAADSARLDGAVPDAYGGVMTGRINGIMTGNDSVEFGAPSGISDANGYQSSESRTLSPDQPVVLRDFAAQMMYKGDRPEAVRFYILTVGNNGENPVAHQLCDIVGDRDSCTAPAGFTIPAGTQIELGVEIVDGPINADALFGYRLTAT